jgi:3-hydroxyisobutyrate dehydrogenase
MAGKRLLSPNGSAAGDDIWQGRSTYMKVGFIGVGNMGWHMAANLVRGGFAVTAFDLRAEQASRWASDHKAASAADLAELGRSVDVVITMLPSGKEVHDVLMRLDNGALVANLRKGAIVIDMSSADPVGTRKLGAELAERDIGLVDAPVSGLVPKAKEGTLSIMIGGDPAHVAAVKPVLEKMGSRLLEVGSLGCGHATKCLNNFLGATNFAAAAEALRVGREFGLDPEILFDVINSSTGRSMMSEVMIKEQVLTGRFNTGFTIGLLAKDVGIAASLAEQIGVDNPIGRLSLGLWSEARDAIGAGQDHTSGATAWEKLGAKK